MQKTKKKERFKRLATLRTKNVLKSLKVLGNCANNNAYEYTDKEVEAIFDAIGKQYRMVKNRFQVPSQAKVDFKLQE